MTPPDVVIKGRRVLTAEGIRPARIIVRSGVIAEIQDFNDASDGGTLFDAGEFLVMPGLVDTHVHINEPGRTHWEGFAAATRAAAAGGVTTLIEMPLNSIPATTSVAALHEKLRAASNQLFVDVGFWGGVVPGNTSELRGLYEAGVFGFKAFLVPSGVEEFAPVTEGNLREAMPILASLSAVLLVHAELPELMLAATAELADASPAHYSTWLRSRPPAAENEAIALIIRLSREFKCRVHIVHLSSCEALACLRRAREESLPITVETCPHYLFFAAEDIVDGATQFKCAPPIRERGNQEQLWSALADGLMDMVVTDHSPSPPEMKCPRSGDFMRAWGGIASLQLTLPVMWTEARRRGHTIEYLARWMCAGPAELAGLRHRKGSIAEGYDADLVVWNPDASFQVETEALHHRHKLMPYAGQVLQGVVQTTFLRGQQVYHRGAFPAGPAGRVLRREAA